MKTIWKFPFIISDVLEIIMPSGAEVLSVGMQSDVPCLWAIVEDTQPVKLSKFYVVGTGHPLNEYTTSQSYVTTFQDGPFVWHVFQHTE